MEENPADYSNKGFLKPGKICGIIGIISGAIYTLVWLIIIIVAAVAEL